MCLQISTGKDTELSALIFSLGVKVEARAGARGGGVRLPPDGRDSLAGDLAGKLADTYLAEENDDETLEAVSRLYEKDIEAFGYRFERP